MEIVGDSEEILSDQEKIKFQVTTSSDYMDAVEKLNKLKSEGGIYFLDIELEKNTEVDSGFDLAEIIKKQDQRAQIIFVTSYDDLSIITYKRRLGPIDYIVKTTNPETAPVLGNRRAHTGSFGINPNYSYESKIYVHKKDFEKAASLVKSVL